MEPLNTETALILRTGWLNGYNKTLDVDQGVTLGEFADLHMPTSLRHWVFAQKNGEPFEDWEHHYPQAGNHYLLYVMPQGGDNGKNAIFSLVAIALTAFAGPAGAALGGALKIGTAAGTALYMIGTTLVLTALQRHLFKPPVQAENGAGGRNPFYQITGVGNTYEPWGDVMRVYGRMRVYPKLIAQPYSRTHSDAEYFYMVFDFGFGPLKLSDFKIGDTLLSNYSDYSPYYYPNFTKSSVLQHFDLNIEPVTVGLEIEVNQNNAPVTTTPINTTRSIIQLVWPSGLYSINAETGNNEWHSTYLEILARPAGSGSFVPIRELAYITSNGNWSATSSNTENSIAVGSVDTVIMYQQLTNWVVGQNVVNGIPAGTAQLNLQVDGYDILGITAGILENVQPGDTLWAQDRYGIMANPVVVTVVSINTSGTSNTLMTVTWPGIELIFNSAQQDFLMPGYGQLQLTLRTLQDTPTGEDYVRSLYFVSSNSTRRMTRDVEFVWMTPGQYDIQIKNYDTDDSGTTINTVYWSSLLNYTNAKTNKVFQPEVPHTVYELRIRATGQLNGVIDSFNCIAESMLPVWNGSSWVYPTYNAATNVWNPAAGVRNPAWIYCDVLRGSTAKRPVPDRLIDFPAILNWAAKNNAIPTNNPAEYASKISYTCDVIINGQTTTREALDLIASTGRAARTKKDSKFSVLLANQATTPVQLITPKNSSNFSASISYVRLPHALKVSYVDEMDSYDQTQLIVYNDGYSKDGTVANTVTATIFEELQLPGTVRRPQAYRLARYYLAAGALQRERITADLDYEQLICQRGDKILCSHDVISAGGMPVRVVKVTTDATNGHIVQFDEPLTSSANAVRYRGTDTIVSVTLIDNDTVRLPAGTAAPIVGDIVEWGVSSTIKAPYIIEEIQPGPDLSATLTMVEDRATEIEAAINGPIPDRVVRPGASLEYKITAVRNLVAYQSTRADLDFVYSDIGLTWLPPANGFPDRYNVYHFEGSVSKTLLRTVTTTEARNILTINRSLLANGATLTFGVEPVVDGIGYGPMAKVQLFIDRDRELPANVTGFGCNAQTGTLLLFWDRLESARNFTYEIRYNPNEVNDWTNAQILVANIPLEATDIMVPLRPGAYFIKARYNTASGNYSPIADSTVVQVDDLEYTDEFQLFDFAPFTSGNYTDVLLRPTGELTLVDDVSVGYYTPPSIAEGIHFAVPTKMRLYAAIKTSFINVDELLNSPWFDPLATAVPISPSAIGTNYTDGQIEFRYMNSANVLRSAVYSNWTKLVVADVTATDVEFRVKLSTRIIGYKPILNTATVRADWLERTEKGSDAAIAAGDTRIDFQYGFAVKPVLSITLQNAQIGDVYIISNLDRNGFNINIYNAAHTDIGGEIDWMAYGYGKEY